MLKIPSLYLVLSQSESHNVYVSHQSSSSSTSMIYHPHLVLLYKTNLYVDDTMFSYTNMGKHHAASQIQKHLYMTSNLLWEWKITIHLENTVVITFGDRQTTDMSKININGHLINSSTSVKYLQVILDSKLNFSKHITSTYNEARPVRAALYTMLNLHSPLPTRTKLQIVKLYIIIILIYAGPFWRALIKERKWKNLEMVQNIAYNWYTLVS